MSEFVECQNCGRRFFAENLDCPYCGGEDDDASTVVADLMRTVVPSTELPVPRRRAGLMDVLFAGFTVLAAAFGLWSAVLFVRAPSPGARAVLAAEAVFAAVTVVGVLGSRRWARGTAIAFITINATLGLVTLGASGLRPLLAWGPGSATLLLFAWPFLSPGARQRFNR